MKKILLTVSVFLLCLLAVRCVYGVEMPFESEKLLAYVGDFQDNSTDLKECIKTYSDVWSQFEDILAKGDSTEIDGQLGGGRMEKTTLDYLKDIGATLVLFAESVTLTIRSLVELFVMIIKDVVVALRLVGYLVFGIIF